MIFVNHVRIRGHSGTINKRSLLNLSNRKIWPVASLCTKDEEIGPRVYCFRRKRDRCYPVRMNCRPRGNRFGLNVFDCFSAALLRIKIS